MARIQVIAKVSGVHAMSGLTLVAGEQYEIEEEHFGDEVFDLAPPPDPGQPASTEEQREELGAGMREA
jgi:hypothetical protein